MAMEDSGNMPFQGEDSALGTSAAREKQDEPETVVWSEDQVFSTEALEDI